MARDIEMSTKYDPSQVEPGRYQKWVDAGLFKPNGNQKDRNIQNQVRHCQRHTAWNP